MIFKNIQGLKSKLERIASTYSSETISYLISEISAEICPVEDVLNLNEEYSMCSPGYNKIGIDMSDSSSPERNYCVSIWRTIKAYDNEDEITLAVNFLYQKPFFKDIFYECDFYIEKEHWLFILDNYFLSEINGQHPIEIIVDVNRDFVG